MAAAVQGAGDALAAGNQLSLLGRLSAAEAAFTLALELSEGGADADAWGGGQTEERATALRAQLGRAAARAARAGLAQRGCVASAAAVAQTRWRGALQDAQKVLEVLEEDGKGEGGAEVEVEEAALWWKAQAAFALGEYETALRACERGREALQRLREKLAGGGGDGGAAVEEEELQELEAARAYDVWMRKCEVELKMEEMEDEDAALEEQAMAMRAEKAREHQQQQADAALPAPAPTKTAAGAGGRIAPVTSTTPAPPRYQYYQDDATLTVEIFLKKQKKDDVTVEFEKFKVHVSVHQPEGAQPLEALNTFLHAAISPEQCRYRVTKTKISVVLHKEAPAQWPRLEGPMRGRSSSASSTGAVGRRGGKPEAPAPDAAPTPVSAPAPSDAADDAAAPAATEQVPRPYASTRDWEEIDRKLAEEEAQEEPEGEEALQKLFRDIYAKADDDTRRAMKKSMQTSGGTVLSTNWAEVSEKDYEKERQAPSGMEWRTWEGERPPQKDN